MHNEMKAVLSFTFEKLAPARSYLADPPSQSRLYSKLCYFECSPTEMVQRNIEESHKGV